jgi:hypothetical protein
MGCSCCVSVFVSFRHVKEQKGDKRLFFEMAKIFAYYTEKVVDVNNEPLFASLYVIGYSHSYETPLYCRWKKA